MKKALIIIFSLIAVLAVVMLVWNFVFGGHVIEKVFNAFAERINAMWASVTGRSGDTDATLIATMDVGENETVVTGW